MEIDNETSSEIPYFIRTKEVKDFNINYDYYKESMPK